jgi:methylglutaconyl-CoA hydratase
MMNGQVNEENCVLTDLDDRGVLKLVLNKPDIHNAFNDEMIKDLVQAFRAFEQNSKIRMVVITGSGKSFCAGADLNWMRKMKNYSFEENLEDAMKLDELFSVMNTFSKPIVAKVNGAALGGGAGLLAVCDFVMASSKAKIGFTESKLGLVPAVISPYVIAKIGESHARANLICGRQFSAIKAYQIGLVHEVVDRDYLDVECEKIVGEFLSAAPKSVILAKELIFNVLEKRKIGKKEVSAFTTEFISKVRITEEAQEGMNALLEKRRPSWQRGSSEGKKS